MDQSFFEQPNEHYVARLMNASDRKTIVATEDIYDSRGVKLWAQGRPITVSLRERLLATKLKKPIEMCVQVEDGIRVADVSAEVRRILDERPTIARLAGALSGKVLEAFGRLSLGNLPGLHLSTASVEGAGAYEHCVMTALISGSLCLRLGMPESAVDAAVMAGLVHDMGELYVNPDLLNAKRELNFEEWKQLAVHPRIGAVLLAEGCKLPAPIVRAVQEHHERLDGSGYPYGITGDQISPLGQMLMIGEVLSAILPGRENPEARALLALRLVHQQFDRNVVALLSDVYHDHSTSMPHGFNMPALAEIARSIDARLKLCQQEVEKVFSCTALPDRWVSVAEHARQLCSFLSMSLHSAGVLSALDRPASELQNDAGIANELHVIVTELKWRMRALSRHIALTVSRWERAPEVFSGIVQSLNWSDARTASPANDSGTALAA